MAVFRAFKAFRPAEKNQALIPELPYDVMSSDEAREIAGGNPLSFLHIDKAEIDLPEGTNIYSPEVYEKAKSNLSKLEQSGDLIQDEAPCFYIYRQIWNGRIQTGIVGCASIDDYINNIIKKHEKTLAKKEEDRIKHVTATNANTGPIFLTYRKSGKISSIIENITEGTEPVYDFMHNDVRQLVWVVSNAEAVEEITSCFASVPALYIADGHHRCASAVKVGSRKREQCPGFTGEEEFNYFLAVAFADADLEIMDYNRVVRDLGGYSKEQLIEKISESFEVSESSSRVRPAEKHSFGMLIENEWYLLKAKPGIIDSENPVKRLDVSILQDYLLAPILGITDPKNDERIDFIGGIRGLGELEKRAQSDMKLAFSMYPTTIDDLISIADAGEIMPPKSTWFEPKLLSGIFIHHLD